MGAWEKDMKCIIVIFVSRGFSFKTRRGGEKTTTLGGISLGLSMAGLCV